MSTRKNIDLICLLAGLLAIAVAVFCIFGTSSGLIVTANAMGYENRLFDSSKVHTIDIVMDDWDSFIASCQSEEYSPCTVVIDGEKHGNVGIRGKGNTSLSNVASMNSERYSFKLEFDQYENGKTYHGLDKLCLNNIIQDNTYMKDFLAYQMMAQFGADTPLCSYVYITVNGEDWGLYLAVEGVEDSFLQRNYGSDHGNLYKPDSMSFGGGRGNGKDFDMEDFDFGSFSAEDFASGEFPQMPAQGISQEDFDFSQMTPPDFGGNVPNGFDPTQRPDTGNTPEMSFDAATGASPEGDEAAAESGAQGEAPDGSESAAERGDRPEVPDMGAMPDIENMPDIGGKGGFGMGSSDVKLQYIDDNADSYSNIFDNAKTDVTDTDKARLISSLKSLSAYESIDSIVDVDEVLRYFVVHNFIVNGDSYTGSMIHNYYLYEDDGKLSMIPWDYNLGFGTFQGGSASASVNDPIDEVLDDRPMQAWIFSEEEYTQQYHALYREFLQSIDIQGMIEQAYALIVPYVAKDPTAFCTYDEFEAGIAALKSFCALRAESVSGQLDGSIPSTDEAQSADGSTLIDTGELNLSDMGTMSTGGGFGGRGKSADDTTGAESSSDSRAPERPERIGQAQSKPFDRQKKAS